MLEEIIPSIDFAARILGVIVLIFGVVGGIYGFYNWIRKKYFAPQIKLLFNQNETFHKATDIRTQTPMYWIHCLARNDSNSIFRNCKSFLNAIYKIDIKGNMQKIKDFNAKLPLQWAHTLGRELIDLLPKEIGRIDLSYMIENKTELFICTSPIPAGTVKSVGDGTYIFEIIAIADNARSDTLYLKIEHNGLWEPEINKIDI